MKKQIGSFHAAARLRVSSTDPIWAEPSPKYAIVASLVPRVLLRPGVAGSEGHAAADDRVCAKCPGLQPLEVHRAAATPGEALRESENLGECPLQYPLDDRWRGFLKGQIPGRNVAERLGEELMMATMRSGDAVTRPQADDGSDSAALLADACVRGAMNEVLRRQFENRFLEGSDQMQLHQHANQEFGSAFFQSSFVVVSWTHGTPVFRALR